MVEGRIHYLRAATRRGAIIKARGLSSAASAANARWLIASGPDHHAHMPAGDWHSVCVCSDGSYGIEKDLICSFPVRSDGDKLDRKSCRGLTIDEFSRGRIDATVAELKE